MTDQNFALASSVHHPVVKDVFRLSPDRHGVRLLAIHLGDPDSYNHVSILVTDERWREIVRGVDAEITRVDAEALSALGGDYAIRCPEFSDGCAETFEGDEKDALVTEHMFAAHPDAVAR